MEYITPLLFATVVLADYYIDNANTSVLYAMQPSPSRQGWHAYSMTDSIALSISNSTGNYTILLDSSYCYNQNYAQGACGTTDVDCFAQIPFTGSGITLYVFNAGLSGMTASFSVDGGAAVSNTIQAPPPPTYQVSNVSLYDIQGLPTGNHTIKMTPLDWGGAATFLKFDYARVNETFVASPATTSLTSSTTFSTISQTPTQTSAGNSAHSHNVNIGSIIGATLGGLALCAILVIGFFYLRKRKATPQVVPTPESTFQVNPFSSEFGSLHPPSVPNAHQKSSYFPQRGGTPGPSIAPLARPAILRDALAAGSHHSSGADQSSQSIRSGQSSAGIQPLRRQPSHSADIDTHRDVRPSASHATDAGSPLSHPEMASRYNLTVGQVEVIDRLRLGNVHLDTIARVVEGFVSSNLAGAETNDRNLVRGRSFVSAAPPPSYQTDG